MLKQSQILELIEAVETLREKISMLSNNKEELIKELHLFKEIFINYTRNNELASQVIGAFKVYKRKTEGVKVNLRKKSEIARKGIKRLNLERKSYKDIKDEILELRRRGKTYAEIQEHVKIRIGTSVSESTLLRLFKKEGVR